MPISGLAKLCRRVGRSLDAGLAIAQIWEGETKRTAGLRRNNFEKVLNKIEGGSSVSDGLKEAQGYFPPLMYEMVSAGEYSGRLGMAFTQLADHYENLIKLRRSFLMGIMWPAFELGFAILIVGALILILGVVTEIAGGEPIDLFGFGLGTTGNFALYVVVVLLCTAAVGIPIVGTMKGWFGSTPIRIANRIPVLGKTIEVLSLSRMAWSLGMAIDAGMDAIRSLQISLNVTQNPLYQEQGDSVYQSLRSGNEMHIALGATGVFPDDFLTSLENGELTGQVTESMNRLARDYRSKAEQLFRLISVIGGVLVMMLVGAIIIVMIFVLFTQLYLNPINDALEM